MFKADGWAKRTAVDELIIKTIPMEKIVIGKPAISGDANAEAYFDLTALKYALGYYYHTKGWKTGVMFPEFASDVDGSLMGEVYEPFSGK